MAIRHNRGVQRTAILVTAAALLALAAPAGTPARTVSCASSDSTTVRENSVARVYEAGDELIACSKRTGRHETLAGPQDQWREVRLRGHWAAFAHEFCLDALGDECGWGVDLVHVMRRETIVFGVDGLPGRVVLRRTGGVAWSADEGSAYAVYRREGRRARRLDRGRDVKAASLRLRGSTLEWRRGTERRTATLR